LSYLTFNYYSRWAQFSYRTAFVSAAVTYGIVVYKAFRARLRVTSRPPPPLISLVGDENVQYLGTSTVLPFLSHPNTLPFPFTVFCPPLSTTQSR
jgi:hypothetical protein